MFRLKTAPTVGGFLLMLVVVVVLAVAGETPRGGWGRVIVGMVLVLGATAVAFNKRQSGRG